MSAPTFLFFWAVLSVAAQLLIRFSNWALSRLDRLD